MTDENSKSEKDHWRRLAQELGLPFDDADDAKEDSVRVEAQSPEALPPPPPHRFTEYAEDDEPIQRAPSPAAAELSDRFEEAEPFQAASVARPDAPELESGEAEAISRVRLEPVGTAGEDDQPRRGRGRRRRGRGRGERRPGDDEAAARAPLPAGESEATTDAIAPGPELPTLAEALDDEGSDEKEGDEPADGEQPGRRKRRRRRRRRKPDEGTANGGQTHAPAAALPAAEEKPALRSAVVDELEDEPEDDEGDQDDLPRGAGAAEDDEPEEDFSDWNVPSWNELIAALYRPDR